MQQLRTQAMGEIWVDQGFEGVTTLLSGNSMAGAVGSSLAQILVDMRAHVDFLRQCLSTAGDIEKQMDGCISSFLLFVDDEKCQEVLSAAIEDADTDRIIRLFLCAPFRRDTWGLLDRYGKAIRERYWRTVSPSWNRYSDTELAELIDRLLAAKRPRAAFDAVHLGASRIETSRLKRLLFDVSTVDAESEGYYRLDPYRISKALDSLDGRPGVTADEMAWLEFMYIKELDRSEHGIPNLERHIAGSPLSFVQALAIVDKRNDGGEDPPEWKIKDPKRGAELTSAVHRLLARINRIPGTGEDGKIDAETLFAWITETRRLCAEYERAKIGDRYIGQLLAKAPAEEDDSWPCLPVCEAMERIGSHEIRVGFNMGVRRQRGATPRVVGEGGAQERALAAKYRSWAKRRAIDYPYVGSVLEGIAASYEWDARWHDDKVKIDQRLER